MTTSQVSISATETGAVYKYVTIESGKTRYGFLTGKNALGSYVTISKLSANPFFTVGKSFDTFDQAQESYKSPLVKTMILLAETILAKA